MCNALAMGFVERVGNLDGIAQHLIQRQRAFLQMLRQGFTFDVLHHEIVGSVLMANIVENADVRMIQTGNGSRFALEALAKLLPARVVVWKDFDGDDAVETRIAGAIHLTHSSRSNAGENFVGTQTLASRGRHSSLVKWVQSIAPSRALREN